MRIKVNNIEWDVSDGYDGSDLPCYEEMDLTEAVDELVADILSDEHGYPVTGFEIEVAE
jgi:hypothetical protein